MKMVSEKRRRRGVPRLVVRLVASAAAVLLVVPIVPWPSAPSIVPALSPYVSITSAMATRSLGWATLICLPVLLTVLVRRRWLCRWVCPVGLCVEYVGRLSPMSASRSKRLPPIGKWLVALAVAGACVGYPLLVFLDPLAMFCGAFSLGRGPLAAAGGVSAGALAVVVAIAIMLPGAWCLRLCPLGAAQDVLILPARLLFRGRSTPAPSAKPDSSGTVLPARRSLLAAGMGALCGGAGLTLGLRARAGPLDHARRELRPPGSVDEWQFHQLCLRCGNCARACPVGIIRPDWRPAKIAGWLTPVLCIEGDYCREDCDACMQVCPSGAIPRRSLTQKASTPIGLAHVNMNRCLLALDRECQTMCVTACPYDAIRLHKWTWEDDRRYPIIDPIKCPGCGACVLACRPMDALAVLPPKGTR